MAICVKRYIHPLDSNGMAAIETKSVFGLVTSVVMELLHVSIVRKFWRVLVLFVSYRH